MHSIRPYPNELFSVLSFIAFILCCIPFLLHLRAGRTYLVVPITWIGLSCLNAFINSIVWNGNITNWAPVWCDISSRLMSGALVAFPSTSFCITRHLYLISHASHATFTKRAKRNQHIFNLGVGLGIPILHIILQYVVQSHRFDIYEDVGCFAGLSIVPFTFPINYGIPSLISLVSVIYGVLTIRTLRRRRQQFEDLLQHSNDSNINSDHYVRLIYLAAVNIVAEFVLNLYIFLIIVPSWNTDWIHSWKSWADTHRGFSHVGQFPVSVWRSWHRAAIVVDSARWICISFAFSFFCFFGFSKECMDQYRSVFMWLRTKTGFLPSLQPDCTLIIPIPQCVTLRPLSAYFFVNLLLG
ncbi:hypothetical protein K443DRAFT_116707 [Laccaria amethystina LaAM-08-1]|uniref:Unplaced genomic scaffold K443scaffold_673, whole genome shotgun sequence n=1 Tax=Laccaria amethystina LaAM-08-1 TaxID=1095629 RepID=A0A0C9X1C1_9AGAR|nr:hypothetical protein K443DRAFT_117154 [Laccaria amethystina LaAM-08-1]KIJ90357.1 hypothetical protein K443DRAFT_116707 [Laccaria amethystina LaAM-08-1]